MAIECGACNQTKAETEFYPRRDRPGQYLSGCRACRSADAKVRQVLARAALLSITPADILAVYSFEPTTGVFKERDGGGEPARNEGGYVVLNLCGIRVLGHRAAWFMYYGRWPNRELDHIDHERTNNRRVNLRQVTRDENARNMSLSARNTSGVVGVSWYEARQKWVAQIGDKSGSGRQTIVLGHFDSFEEAVQARKEAESRLGYHVNHGAERQSDQEVA